MAEYKTIETLRSTDTKEISTYPYALFHGPHWTLTSREREGERVEKAPVWCRTGRGE